MLARVDDHGFAGLLIDHEDTLVGLSELDGVVD